MRVSLLPVIAVLACGSVSAYAVPLEGSPTTIEGPAHLRQLATGTYVYVGDPITLRVSFPLVTNRPSLVYINSRVGMCSSRA